MSSSSSLPQSPPHYFAYFGLEPTFNLSQDALQKSYFDHQRLYHPDQLTQASETERLSAIRYSMSLTEAYRTLQSPLSRAYYLLELQGYQLNKEALKAGQTLITPSHPMLAEILEERQTLEEASTREEIAALTHATEQRQAELLSELDHAFSTKQWEHAAQLTLRLRYFLKWLEEAKLKERSLKNSLGAQNLT